MTWTLGGQEWDIDYESYVCLRCSESKCLPSLVCHKYPSCTIIPEGKESITQGELVEQLEQHIKRIQNAKRE